MTARVRLTGVVPVALPPEEAFLLFTPSGERAWAEGWDPKFPTPADDETEPGTVFEVEHGGRRSTWVVAACVPAKSITYARVAVADRAGLVTVDCEASADGTTQATVTYDLTALSDEAQVAVHEFASNYTQFLEHWRIAIAEATRHV